MTDQTTPEVDDDDMTVSINLYPEGGETKALRQVAYGIQPFVLLEVEEGDNGEIRLAVIGSLVDDLEELATMVEGYAEVIRAAVDQNAAAQVKTTEEVQP